MTRFQRFLFNTSMMSEKVKFVLWLHPVLWCQYFTYFKKLLPWRKSPEDRRFKLYAQSGPFESGDFANFGENGEKAPESWQFKLDAKSGKKGENGDLGENEEFGTRAGDIRNVANILIGCHVASWHQITKEVPITVRQHFPKIFSNLTTTFKWTL